MKVSYKLISNYPAATN